MSKASLQAQFGARVRELREEAGLAQETLAAKAKLSRHYISELESGKRNPSLNVMGQLAAALKLSLSQLLDI